MKLWSEFVTIGRVLKPQGRKGEIAVHPLSDREDRFPGLRRAFVPASGGEVRELAVDGMTMIVVTHEMGFARHAANRVVFMDDGQLVESAPPAEFFASPRSERAKDFLSKILTH